MIYAGGSAYEYQLLLPCSTVDLSSLLDTQEQVESADALRRWFIGENMLSYDWIDSIWNHRVVVLSEPFIIKSETPSENEIIIYCASAIAAYSLLQASDDAIFFAEGIDECGLFQIYFSKEDGEWIPYKVHCLRDMDEELYSGAGKGVEGFPGLSVALSELIPDWGFTTESIALKYLDSNCISATIVTW